MRKLLMFLMLTVISLHANDNVIFRQAVPNFTTLSKIEVASDFAVDKAGNYYLLDAAGKNIYVYDTNSNLIRTIPLNGFANPAAIELSSGDNIYVLDRELKKIYSIDQSGNIVLSFGSADGDAGNLNDPFYMTTDFSENIYVLDAGRNEMMKFNSSGLFRGSFKISNPVALAVDREQVIHLLRKDESGSYSVTNISEGLSFIDEIKILNVFSPVDIAVNFFGEYFIVDEEAGKIIRYGRYGNVIGEPIGKKSTSKGRGQFANPKRIFYSFINNETEEISILDSKFNLCQSFQITTLHEREKLKEKNPFLPIEISTIMLRNPGVSYFCGNGYDFFVTEDKVSVVKDSKELFAITDQRLGEVSGVANNKNSIVISESADNKIFLFDLTSGAFKSEIISSPSDVIGIVTDSKNNIYAISEENIIIFDESGTKIGDFESKGLHIPSPVRFFSISLDDIICLKLENDNYYYQYDISSQKYSQVKLHKAEFAASSQPFTITTNGITTLYNDSQGTVEIFKDGVFVDGFLSKGRGEQQMTGVEKMYFDRQNSELVLLDEAVIKKFKLSLPSDHNLRLDVDELGFAQLLWDSDKSGAARYKIYRRENKNQDFQFVTEVNETKYSIMEETPAIYEYAITSVNEGTEGILSNSVIDGYTFARTIRFNRPEEAIDLLNQYRDINPTAVDNQALAIYRELVDEYKQEKKYELALRNVSKMKSIKPNNFAFYIERSEILEKMRRINDAIDELKIAKEKFPGQINVYYYLIRLQKLQNDYRTAIATANDALTQFSGDERILAELADAYYQLKIFNESARYYRVLYQQTGKSEYSIQAGRILVAQKKYDEAFALYEQLKTAGKTSGVLYSAIAEAYIEKGQDTKAIGEINQGLQVEPDNGDLYYLLGNIHKKLGDKNAAQTAYEKAVELDDTRTEFNLALADVLLQKGLKDEAVFYFETAVLYSPENIDALLKLGSIYLDENKVDYAFRHLSKAYQLAPGRSDITAKYNEVRTKRDQLNATREPIEFNFINLPDINLRRLDLFNPSNYGSVTLFNTRNEPLTDILIQIECPDLISLPVLLTVPLLQPNEFNENYFDLKIEKNLAEKINKRSVKIDFILSYDYMGEKRTLTKQDSIVIVE